MVCTAKENTFSLNICLRYHHRRHRELFQVNESSVSFGVRIVMLTVLSRFGTLLGNGTMS
jgi:hypothetical protein